MELIIPMEPIIREQVFDSEEFTYQLKWDGVRMLTYSGKSRVELINKRLNNRTAQYPELQALNSLLHGRQVILDGEIVTFKDSKVSFPAIMRRDNARTEKSIAMLLKEVPVNYIVFDLLWDEDKDLRTLSLMERKQRLQDILTPQDGIHIIEDFPSGSSLFTAVQGANLEGIVAKKKASPYLAGKKHRDWFKIKYRRRQSCVIGGYTLRNNIANSLLLGVYQGDNLHYVGRAGSGLSESQCKELHSLLSSLQSDKAPFVSLPAKIARESYFVKPDLVVDVEFAEWTENMHLRSPVINKVRGEE
ncbi:MAG: non-homologous end-joining DNA ligase [Syntrophomonadaceae bacterium]|nr:non-homologous end-joining DNA ligase [Syntrophomonadaceae bacterium]MDD3898038.1 non-homologous end-joining DNA ligase [Syntrophomonadaceae bacterium]